MTSKAEAPRWYRDALAAFSGYRPHDAVIVDDRGGSLELSYVGRGGALLTLQADSPRGVLWIRRLEIAPELRSIGAGRSLAAAAEKVPRELALPTIHVFPRHQAQGFWTRLGFEPTP